MSTSCHSTCFPTSEPLPAREVYATGRGIDIHCNLLCNRLKVNSRWMHWMFAIPIPTFFSFLSSYYSSSILSYTVPHFPILLSVPLYQSVFVSPHTLIFHQYRYLDILALAHYCLYIELLNGSLLSECGPLSFPNVYIKTWLYFLRSNRLS
jgi:hypothetical protein